MTFFDSNVAEDIFMDAHRVFDGECILVTLNSNNNTTNSFDFEKIIIVCREKR